MFIRKYWLPLSVFIVAIIGVGLYLLATQPPPEPVKIYKVVEPEKPTQQPTAETPVFKETPQPQQDGHFHTDGTFHTAPHEAPVEVWPLSTEDVQIIETIDWENLTPKEIMYLLEQERWPHLTQAQREIVHREFYAQSLGVKPPPEGYYYRVQANGHPVLDENGTPKLFKEGESIFTVKKVIGFAPTREQYKQYNELITKHNRAYLAGNTAEVKKYSALIDELMAEARGEVPIVTASTFGSPTLSEAEHDKRVAEISNQAYRDMGLGYMVDE